MIPHDRFHTLRLHEFVPGAEIQELRDWEFEGHQWVGEALGFSEWLRLESEPDLLRSLSIDLAQFPPDAARAVFDALELPLETGMTRDELEAILDAPDATNTFVADRETIDFVVDGDEGYMISCTVLHDGGLTHVTVTTPLPSSRDLDDE